MPRPVRLIALDLDGTTLDSNRRIPPENLAAVRRAQASGIRVILASGRISTSMDRFAKELDAEWPRVCANGGHVLGEQGEEVAHDALDRGAAALVWDYAEAHGLHLNAYARFDLMFRSRTAWVRLYHQRLGFELGRVAGREEALAGEITKLMVVDKPANIPEHRARLEQLLEGLPVTLTESEPEYLEFLPEGGSKGRGLARLAAHLGIDAEETAAIGDYWNDLEMLRWAGYSGAVANAEPEIRESVDFVGPSNNEAGVARFIDWVLANAGQ